MILGSWAGASGQETNDTTIYQVAEEMPRFPACEQLDTTLEVIKQCANEQLLNFIYSNIVYPQEAIKENLEGTVVTSFVVEKDGAISNPKIVKDIGGGAGVEALRVIDLMNQAEIRWVPGKNKGKAVRSSFTLPVRFKIEEPLPYVIVGRDTIYTEYDRPLEYAGGTEALTAYLNDRLKYPEAGNDSCLIGNIEVQVLVRRNGDVRILDLIDYNDLGFDFWYAAIEGATSTLGKWTPAEYQGKKVAAAFDMSMPFVPTAAACKQKVADYEKATAIANEGAELFSAEKQEEGIAKMTEALQEFPNDAAFLLMRGQAYLDRNELGKACEDLSKARRIALVDWYDSLLPYICR